MNLWRCDHPGCDKSCVGTGGAVGLRAIGWYFQVGPVTLCPAHRPDGIPCADDGRSEGVDDTLEKNPCCPFCSAEVEADRLQTLIIKELGLSAPKYRSRIAEAVAARAEAK